MPLHILQHPCWVWSDNNRIIFGHILKKTSREILLNPVNFNGLLKTIERSWLLCRECTEWLLHIAQRSEKKSLKHRILNLFNFGKDDNIQVNLG